MYSLDTFVLRFLNSWILELRFMRSQALRFPYPLIPLIIKFYIIGILSS